MCRRQPICDRVIRDKNEYDALSPMQQDRAVQWRHNRIEGIRQFLCRLLLPSLRFATGNNAKRYTNILHVSKAWHIPIPFLDSHCEQGMAMLKQIEPVLR